MGWVLAEGFPNSLALFRAHVVFNATFLRVAVQLSPEVELKVLQALGLDPSAPTVSEVYTILGLTHPTSFAVANAAGKERLVQLRRNGLIASSNLTTRIHDAMKLLCHHQHLVEGFPFIGVEEMCYYVDQEAMREKLFGDLFLDETTGRIELQRAEYETWVQLMAAEGNHISALLTSTDLVLVTEERNRARLWKEEMLEAIYLLHRFRSATGNPSPLSKPAFFSKHHRWPTKEEIDQEKEKLKSLWVSDEPCPFTEFISQMNLGKSIQQRRRRNEKKKAKRDAVRGGDGAGPSPSAPFDEAPDDVPPPASVPAQPSSDSNTPSEPPSAPPVFAASAPQTPTATETQPDTSSTPPTVDPVPPTTAPNPLPDASPTSGSVPPVAHAAGARTPGVGDANQARGGDYFAGHPQKGVFYAEKGCWDDIDDQCPPSPPPPPTYSSSSSARWEEPRRKPFNPQRAPPRFSGRSGAGPFSSSSFSSTSSSSSSSSSYYPPPPPPPRRTWASSPSAAGYRAEVPPFVPPAVTCASSQTDRAMERPPHPLMLAVEKMLPFLQTGHPAPAPLVPEICSCVCCLNARQLTLALRRIYPTPNVFGGPPQENVSQQQTKRKSKKRDLSVEGERRCDADASRHRHRDDRKEKQKMTTRHRDTDTDSDESYRRRRRTPSRDRERSRERRRTPLREKERSRDRHPRARRHRSRSTSASSRDSRRGFK